MGERSEAITRSPLPFKSICCGTGNSFVLHIDLISAHGTLLWSAVAWPEILSPAPAQGDHGRLLSPTL